MKKVVMCALLVSLVFVLAGTTALEASSTCACDRCVERIACKNACVQCACPEGEPDTYFQGTANWIRWWPCSTKQVRECRAEKQGEVK